jgi:hypothetical protein
MILGQVAYIKNINILEKKIGHLEEKSLPKSLVTF